MQPYSGGLTTGQVLPLLAEQLLVVHIDLAVSKAGEGKTVSLHPTHLGITLRANSVSGYPLASAQGIWWDKEAKARAEFVCSLRATATSS